MPGGGSASVPKITRLIDAKLAASTCAMSRTSLSSSNTRNRPDSPLWANTACMVRRHMVAKPLKAPCE
jgi:hypothetical protein